jgi:hypothetical protein
MYTSLSNLLKYFFSEHHLGLPTAVGRVFLGIDRSFRGQDQGRGEGQIKVKVKVQIKVEEALTYLNLSAPQTSR